MQMKGSELMHYIIVSISIFDDSYKLRIQRMSDSLFSLFHCSVKVHPDPLPPG